uniref:Uncharacterized protein n=1 Tax=Caenorhabditis japonica TaxID=281687 RepID=A0A8R1HSH8_CAEJA
MNTASALISEVNSLEKNFADMKKSQPVNYQKTFAEAVSKSIAAPSTGAIIAKAVQAATIPDSRKCSLIIKGVENASELSAGSEFGKSISNVFNVASPKSMFPIAQKTGPPLLKIQLESTEDMSKVLNLFSKRKVQILSCQNASARPDLSKMELEKYRLAWKDAIERNNQAKARIYTVRNLEVTKIVYRVDQTPWEWKEGGKQRSTSQ